jgi:hypothetical protein
MRWAVTVGLVALAGAWLAPRAEGQEPAWPETGATVLARVVSAPTPDVGSCFSVAGPYYVPVRVDLLDPRGPESVVVAVRCGEENQRLVHAGRRVNLTVLGVCDDTVCGDLPASEARGVVYVDVGPPSRFRRAPRVIGWEPVAIPSDTLETRTLTNCVVVNSSLHLLSSSGVVSVDLISGAVTVALGGSMLYAVGAVPSMGVLFGGHRGAIAGYREGSWGWLREPTPAAPTRRRSVDGFYETLTGAALGVSADGGTWQPDADGVWAYEARPAADSLAVAIGVDPLRPGCTIEPFTSSATAGAVMRCRRQAFVVEGGAVSELSADLPLGAGTRRVRFADRSLAFVPVSPTRIWTRTSDAWTGLPTIPNRVASVCGGDGVVFAVGEHSVSRYVAAAPGH